MASWTSIPDSSLDPDAPVTSELAYAWRDNPIAITEGASGAPRIQQSAMMDPTAGATNTLKWLPDFAVGGGIGISDKSTVMLGGSMTVSFGFTRTAGTLGFFRFRNGLETQLFNKSASGTYSEDLSVIRGDVLYFGTVGGSATFSLGNIKFSSDANSMALA